MPSDAASAEDLVGDAVDGLHRRLGRCLRDLRARHCRRQCVICPGEILRISAEGLVSEQGVPAAETSGVLHLRAGVLCSPLTPSWTASPSMPAVTTWAASLALECPVEADMVIGTPDSGLPSAEGYAFERHSLTVPASSRTATWPVPSSSPRRSCAPWACVSSCTRSRMNPGKRIWRSRRLHRARHHHGPARAHAASGRRQGDPHPHQLPGGCLAVL